MSEKPEYEVSLGSLYEQIKTMRAEVDPLLRDAADSKSGWSKYSPAIAPTVSVVALVASIVLGKLTLDADREQSRTNSRQETLQAEVAELQTDARDLQAESELSNLLGQVTQLRSTRTRLFAEEETYARNIELLVNDALMRSVTNRAADLVEPSSEKTSAVELYVLGTLLLQDQGLTERTAKYLRAAMDQAEEVNLLHEAAQRLALAQFRRGDDGPARKTLRVALRPTGVADIDPYESAKKAVETRLEWVASEIQFGRCETARRLLQRVEKLKDELVETYGDAPTNVRNYAKQQEDIKTCETS